MGIDYSRAREVFEQYLNGYDRKDGKVRLKITHTYGVVAQSTALAKRMRLGEEDTQLARIIALLHDIGRFEQLRRFDSFLPETMDHAAYGVELLFGEGMIRDFLPEDTWDGIIRTAIAKHSDYRLEGVGRSPHPPPRQAHPGCGQAGQLPGEAGGPAGDLCGGHGGGDRSSEDFAEGEGGGDGGEVYSLLGPGDADGFLGVPTWPIFTTSISGRAWILWRSGTTCAGSQGGSPAPIRRQRAPWRRSWAL